jgi:hypothetical protein
MALLTSYEFFLGYNHAIPEDKLLPTGEKEQDIVDNSNFQMWNEVVIIFSGICLQKIKNRSRYITGD